jgi:hypothetical protein
MSHSLRRMAFGRLVTIVQNFNSGTPTLMVSARSSRGQFQSAHGKFTVSSRSVHGQLAVRVNILYLHLNVLIPTVTLTSRATQMGDGILRENFGTKSNVDWLSFEHARLSSGQWTVDIGMWTVECGPWTVECGQRTVECGQLAVGSGQWAVKCEQWIVDSGEWAVDRWQWAVDGWQWAVDSWQ